MAGLFNRNIKRIKDNEKRIENQTPFERYLKQIEWVDLGHPDTLFSMSEFIWMDNFLFSFNEIKEMLTYLTPDISIIMNHEVQWLRDNCIITKSTSGLPMIECISKENGKKIFFMTDPDNDRKMVKYFLHEINDWDRVRVMEVGPQKIPSFLGHDIVYKVASWDHSMEEQKYTFKLAKTKQ